MEMDKPLSREQLTGGSRDVGPVTQHFRGLFWCAQAVLPCDPAIPTLQIQVSQIL